jgi:hypothetical protein
MAESAGFASQSIFRQKPAPDLIRGGHRFAAENAIKLGIFLAKG